MCPPCRFPEGTNHHSQPDLTRGEPGQSQASFCPFTTSKACPGELGLSLKGLEPQHDHPVPQVMELGSQAPLWTGAPTQPLSQGIEAWDPRAGNVSSPSYLQTQKAKGGSCRNSRSSPAVPGVRGRGGSDPGGPTSPSGPGCVRMGPAPTSQRESGPPSPFAFRSHTPRFRHGAEETSGHSMSSKPTGVSSC